MLPWCLSHTHTHTPPCHLQLVDGMCKTVLIHSTKPDFLAFKSNTSTLRWRTLNNCASYTPTSCCSIFISFWFSTVHLTGFPIHIRKLLIIYHSSHKPDICSSLTKITCSHQKMSSWTKDICRMKLVYYRPGNKTDQFKTTANCNYTTQP